MEQPNSATLTVGQAAKWLGISRNLAYEAARRNELPVIRIGKRLLVSRSGLEKMLEQAGQLGWEHQVD